MTLARGSKSLSQYLAVYAEPESRAVNLTACSDISHRWDFVVVIPSLGEDLLGVSKSIRCAAAQSRKSVLTIEVVNHRNDHSVELQKSNFDRIAAINRDCRMLSAATDTPIYFEPPGRIIVDRATRPLPPKQGVGLARKIGCDVALQLIASNRICSQWIHCTDGDCEVPLDYFEFEAPPNACAYLYPFEHVLDWNFPFEAEALRLYDSSLRSFVEGLRSAGSPYAYHSLGSTMAIHAPSYAAVRGFPKVNAAEDFYLLGKLAKLGNILSATGSPIRIRQRVSDRVPFGTGVATRKIADNLRAGEASHTHTFTACPPGAVERLRKFLAALREIAQTKTDVLGRLEPGDVPDGAREAVETALRTRTSPDQILRHLNSWFDALRTKRYLLP